MQSPTVAPLWALPAATTGEAAAAVALRAANKSFEFIHLLLECPLAAALAERPRWAIDWRRAAASAGRIAQPAEEARQAQPLLPGAAPFGFPPFELHHVVDPPVEEGGGVGPTLRLVVEPRKKRRGVHRAERHALGVMVEVG